MKGNWFFQECALRGYSYEQVGECLDFLYDAWNQVSDEFDPNKLVDEDAVGSALSAIDWLEDEE